MIAQNHARHNKGRAETGRMMVQRLFPVQTQQAAAGIGVALAFFLGGPAFAGILPETDFRKAESLKPLFANLMNDLVETAKRPDLPSGDAGCINSTIRELLQISDELGSYEYLITMEKQMPDFGENSPMRRIVIFAIEKSSMILTDERKRLAHLSDQCSKNPVGFGKTQEALSVIDTTTGILASIRSGL